MQVPFAATSTAAAPKADVRRRRSYGGPIGSVNSVQVAAQVGFLASMDVPSAMTYVTRHQPTRMKVTTRRRDGSVDVRCVVIPPPIAVSYRGLARLPAYVHRVLASRKRFASAIVSRPDGEVSISVWKYASQVTVNLSLKNVSACSAELEVRRLAVQRGYSVAEDYLANDGEVRIIHWALPPEEVKVATFAELLLHDVFGIRRLGPLHFSYEETDDR